MSQQNEASILEFISRTANPFVTLTQLRAHVGESAFGVSKIHLGALTRKKYVHRANLREDVIYWTDATAKLVEALLVKPVVTTPIPNTVISSSPYAKKETPVKVTPAPAPAPRISFTFDPVSAPAAQPVEATPPAFVDGVRVAHFALQKRPQKIYMGSLRRSGLNGIVAMAMFSHAGKAFTPQSVEKMCPDMVLNDIRRVLNYLCQGDRLLGSGLSYLKRSLTSPFVYRWSELYEYPFSERLEGDSDLCVKVDIAGWTSNPPTAFYDDDPLKAEEYEKTLRAFNEVKTPPTSMRKTSVADVRTLVVEPAASQVDTPIPKASAAVAEEIAAATDDVLENKVDDPETIGEKGMPDCAVKVEVLEPAVTAEESTPTDEEAKRLAQLILAAGTAKVTAMQVTNSSIPVPNFDAHLNLAGELTLFVQGRPIKLGKYDTRCLVSLLGPHYVAEQHRLLAKPKSN